MYYDTRQTFKLIIKGTLVEVSYISGAGEG